MEGQSVHGEISEVLQLYEYKFKGLTDADRVTVLPKITLWSGPASTTTGGG